MSMQIINVDFETFYDKAFSLSKMTTEEYIRDELFEVIGVAVKVDDEETQWFSGTKKKTSEWLDQFPWDNSVAIAHNAMFDMAILNWHFDIRPKRIADTLSMARAIDGPDAGNSLAKLAERHGLGVKGNEVVNALGKGRLDFTPEELARYGEYCINDVELTFQLFRKLAAGFPLVELRLIDLTIRMFTEPVLELDKPTLEEHLTKVRGKKDQLLAAAHATGKQGVLMSNPQLATLLTRLGVDPPKKISATTGKETWAFGKTDEGFKALLDHSHPAVQAIVAARLGVKSTLEETRTERFIGIADRGTLPVPLRYYAAHTGRWGGDDKVNLQNLPRKSALKRAIRAPKGYVFIDCDSSQIEARTLAWLSGQDDLVDAFDKGEDVYRIMASRIYGVSVEEVTKAQRQVGKVVVLGAGYGLGWKKFISYALQQGIVLTDEEAQDIIAIYRATYPQIPKLWDEANRVLGALLGPDDKTAPLGRKGVLVVERGITLPNGLSIKYPGLRKQWDKKAQRYEIVYDQKKGRAVISTRIYGGKVVENVCQALARIVIGEQMLMVARRLRVVMTVHDAVGAIAPEAEADEGRKFIEDCMRIRPKWALGLPLNCESKIGASYGG